jgi:AAA15 family ATPase/GTPase
MNITKFGLSNFRVFKEHFDFELAPIMVLTGPNNSGKSSLTKALLLT